MVATLTAPVKVEKVSRASWRVDGEIVVTPLAPWGEPDGHAMCTCSVSRHGQPCRHIATVFDAITAEREAAAQAAHTCPVCNHEHPITADCPEEPRTPGNPWDPEEPLPEWLDDEPEPDDDGPEGDWVKGYGWMAA